MLRNASVPIQHPVAPKAWWSNRVVEKSVLHYVNKERLKARLKPLVGDQSLMRSARGHSGWMAKTGKYSHGGAWDSTPSDRAMRAGYGDGAGENIWWTSSQRGTGRAWKSKFRWDSDWKLGKAAVISWMNSPGHRANILMVDYKHIGIGVAKNKRGALYLTQNFGRKDRVGIFARSWLGRNVLIVLGVFGLVLVHAVFERAEKIVRNVLP